MPEDMNLELIRRRRLAEMRKTAAAKQGRAQPPRGEADASKVLQRVFVGRAWEVYHAARRQYPGLADRVFDALARLVKGGRLRGPIGGEQLYGLLRDVGLDVKLDTRIRVMEHGELKSLSEKLRGD